MPPNQFSVTVSNKNYSFSTVVLSLQPVPHITCIIWQIKIEKYQIVTFIGRAVFVYYPAKRLLNRHNVNKKCISFLSSRIIANFPVEYVNEYFLGGFNSEKEYIYIFIVGVESIKGIVMSEVFI